MNVPKSLLPKFSRLEELVGIVSEFDDVNHIIDQEKIPLVREAVDEGLKLLQELMQPNLPEPYDLEAGKWLVAQRVIFKEAKGDLTLPWNQPPEQNPNKIHGVSGEDEPKDHPGVNIGDAAREVLAARQEYKRREITEE